MRHLLRVAATLCLVLVAAAAWGAGMQPVSRPHIGPSGAPLSRNQPVTFTADAVSYDRTHGILTATGHVEAWQNDHVLRADKITFDRNTNVAAAYGHVVIVEPDGQVLFADYAELTQGMRNAVLRGMRAILQQNGKLAANGARRTEGKINEMSRAVYSTCNVCALDPSRPPFWQLRAASMTQDLEHKKDEYHDVYLDMFGYPVLYLPYFANADPSAKRESGLLTPTIGLTDKYLGTFVSLPYYWVLNNQSDLTLTPTLSTETGPQLETRFRERFNNGTLVVTDAAAYDQSHGQGFIFANGQFDYNDNWRYGININEASSIAYMRDFQIPGYGNDMLTSQAYLEGFGEGSYARLDARAYQVVNAPVSQSELPYVLPRYEYDYFGQPDALGGRLSVQTSDFNVLRQQGTNDQRAALGVNWDRPFAGPIGSRWLLTFNLAAAAYNANDLTETPNYALVNHGQSAHAQPTAALKVNWPFLRDSGALGTQLIEPIVQVIAATNSGNSRHDLIPNEDSLTYEFTDATLFNLNRFAANGYDRFDSGPRANVALHGNWTFNGGQQIDGLIGQSYQEHIDENFLPDSGLGNHVSDIVGRLTFVPTNWLDFIGRGRFDKDNFDVHFADGLVSAGVPLLRVDAGYFYSSTDPFLLYDQNYYQTGLIPTGFYVPRNEASVGVSSHRGNWTVSANARRNLENGQMVSLGADGKYENECFIFDVNFFRRYTSIDGDNGDTTILFTLTFKTVGQFGFNAS